MDFNKDIKLNYNLTSVPVESDRVLSFSTLKKAPSLVTDLALQAIQLFSLTIECVIAKGMTLGKEKSSLKILFTNDLRVTMALEQMRIKVQPKGSEPLPNFASIYFLFLTAVLNLDVDLF